jgi:hypothetical protein
MSDRKQFLNDGEPPDPELVALLEAARKLEVSEEEMREQRISFAYGNALEMDSITKESVREASLHIRLRY